MTKKVMADFTKETGYTVRIERNGDAGELTNKLVLTKGDPIADGVFGIDNTFASRAVDAGVLASYSPADAPASETKFALSGKGAGELTPIDYGDVCVNVDDAWFAKKKLAEPKTFDDLTKPAYKGLFVTPGAATSSPGLAFLIATIGKYGDGWKAYWGKLMANDVKLDAGWDDAWNVDYSGGPGKGDRPIILSYSSSPADTIDKATGRSTTSALLDTCFRQVEYAGVLKDAKNPKGAKAFVDFMTRKEFQSALPGQMYVYPSDTTVALPADWSKWAAVSPDPVPMTASEITANRTGWLRDWRDITTQ
jgi:thiamine transport system substrate-binding protein